MHAESAPHTCALISLQERAIAAGRVRINKQKVTPQTIVKQHAEITHTVHRHEPPVIGSPVKIVMQNDEMVVVDKPPSIPVRCASRGVC